MNPEWSKTADDYATHRKGFPKELFERCYRNYGLGKSGDVVLDLGTGTGTVARSFALRGCKVTAIDPVQKMLDQASMLDKKENFGNASPPEYKQGYSENTGLAESYNHSFDVISAGQCWHWFDSQKALKEVTRLLKKDTGKLLICHFDWLPYAQNIAEKTEELVLAHTPSWTMNGGTGFYPKWAIDCAKAGFRNIETFSFVVDVEYSHEAWRGRMRAMSAISATLPPEEVAVFDRELSQMLAQDFPNSLLHIPHRVWALIAAAPL
eukprot:TRINITY_DN12502_c0_g1_i1.p1 TRINITY_DN12502_c0_g1~~TRINITY_DN12502_c0_g1_i1.p1  ORF type:complete len:275 (-),score=43.51 TRINITY_DN12502_c0_g1_i1:72-866(-)